MTSTMKLVPRRSLARGNADHGWLKSFHTFSFANYYDPQFQDFGPLRVINEDRVAPTTGFGAHSHKEFEIFSYVVEGELQHNDSMGNREILRRGEIQMTSAGTGITHSEYNTNPDAPVHFLQIWCKPNRARLTPTYSTKAFSDESKRDKLALVVQDVNVPIKKGHEEGEAGPVPIHADMALYATLLSPQGTVTHHVQRDSAYLHLIMKSGYETPSDGGTVTVNGQEMKEGDGMYVHGSGELKILNTGAKETELLLFDLRQ